MHISNIMDLVLYQDDEYLVLNKPAGIAVHKGYGGGVALDSYLPQLQGDAPRVPGLGHRIDRDTAGCLVLGRTDAALKHLNRVFANHRVQKSYWAVVYGAPYEASGSIQLPLLQKQGATNWRVVVDEANGQHAQTDWVKRGTGAGKCWLECTPITGRTHQIRVHCAAMGYPLIGDHLYGGAIRGKDPLLHLHARHIAFKGHHGHMIEVIAPPPAHMLEALHDCGWSQA